MKRILHISLIAVFAIASNLISASESKPVAKVADYLVNAAGDSVDVEAIASKPYVLFYYSAHWCPPCRKFTPKLVEFYNKNGGGEAFEIVFVSSDHSKEKMYGYMEEAGMSWLAVGYDDVEKTDIRSYGGPYIPSLVMFDQEGNLVAGAFDFEADEYIGPDSVLKALSEVL